MSLCTQLDQLKSEKSKLHKEKVDLENQLEAEQVWSRVCGVGVCGVHVSVRRLLAVGCWLLARRDMTGACGFQKLKPLSSTVAGSLCSLLLLQLCVGRTHT